jgi:hypothetical protein
VILPWLTVFLLGTAAPQVQIRLDHWTAKIEPNTLTIRAIPDGGSKDILVSNGPANRATEVEQTSDSVSWKAPDLRSSSYAVAIACGLASVPLKTPRSSGPGPGTIRNCQP